MTFRITVSGQLGTISADDMSIVIAEAAQRAITRSTVVVNNNPRWPSAVKVERADVVIDVVEANEEDMTPVVEAVSTHKVWPVNDELCVDHLTVAAGTRFQVLRREPWFNGKKCYVVSHQGVECRAWPGHYRITQ